MAKLTDLIDGMAVALQVPGSRVRTAAAELRKHKMVKTGPRGPGAPDMEAGDATALLFAIMYDDELTAAATNVERLYSAPLLSSSATRRGERSQEMPAHALFQSPEGAPNNLGQAVETMLAGLVQYGTIGDESDDPNEHLEVFNLSLSIDAPGHRAHIHFNNFDAFWDLAYQWKSAEQIAYESTPSQGIDIRRRWDALKGPYMSSSRWISEDSLTLVADCLRGGELPDEWDADDSSGHTIDTPKSKEREE